MEHKTKKSVEREKFINPLK